jgi:DNA invertase Pin-like site-specific DNA recombinase
LQRDALKAAGCRRVFADEGVSGSVTARRGLDAALTTLSAGDTLVVWKLDRLGRSLSHLVTLIAELGARGVNFRSLSDPIDTASSGGRLVMHIMGALAEFERGLIVERTQAGIQAASLIFEEADTTGLEEDARLTAMWLWTRSSGSTADNEVGDVATGTKRSTTKKRR